MKKVTFFIAFISCFTYCLAQKHDYLWLIGYDSNPNDPNFGGSVIDFNLNPPDVYYEYREMNFLSSAASICDSSGNLLFYTNGIYIANNIHEPMINGEQLALGTYEGIPPYLGLQLQQGVLVVPAPENINRYYLFHAPLDVGGYPTQYSSKIYYSVIDMTLDNGRGAVIEKNVVAIDDILHPGYITGTRHANGRDWWVVVRKYNTGEYYRLLIHPAGVENYGIQNIGLGLPHPGVGQAVFSPDGSKYANYQTVTIEGGSFLDIYNFDRCSGTFSEPVRINHIDSAWAAGAAISPNSRFLYASSFVQIYQYDLWAPDIEASKDTVAIWDGFFVPPVFATTFFLAQLAPDGKIYISANNSVPYLHVINNPDLPGDSCDVCQHCVQLPTWNAFSMPNFPNYRLGALEGSPCDTLRQPPTALWSYESQDPEVAFQDSSYHDIRTWHWDFGDGVTDTVSHPVHSYAVNGVYNVCLAVSNPRGADTLCRQIQVIVNGVDEAEGGILANISPNPVINGIALLKLEAWVKLDNPQVIIRDALGREVLREPLRVVAGKVQQELKVGLMAAGVYFCSVEEAGVAVWQGKIIKQ